MSLPILAQKMVRVKRMVGKFRPGATVGGSWNPLARLVRQPVWPRMCASRICCDLVDCLERARATYKPSVPLWFPSRAADLGSCLRFV